MNRTDLCRVVAVDDVQHVDIVVVWNGVDGRRRGRPVTRLRQARQADAAAAAAARHHHHPDLIIASAAAVVVVVVVAGRRPAAAAAAPPPRHRRTNDADREVTLAELEVRRRDVTVTSSRARQSTWRGVGVAASRDE